jgi:hypothetical protein
MDIGLIRGGERTYWRYEGFYERVEWRNGSERELMVGE